MTTAPANPPSESRVNLLNLSPAAAQAQLAAFLERAGEPKYRAAQIARRLWLNPAPSFDQMTELPKALRESLAAAFDLPRLEIAARQKSSDGTEKFLFRLADGEAIETRRDSRGRPRHSLHFVAGRMRAAVRVLRDRRDGFQPEPLDVRDRRSGARDALARSADRHHERRLHGHGRAAHELEGRRSARSRSSTIPPASGSARATSPSPRSAFCRGSSRSANVRNSSGSPSRSTRRATRCGAS